MVDLSGTAPERVAAVDLPDESPTTPARHIGLRHAVELIALASALPIALFLILRPNTYGIVPNPLDPAFYTGYALNLEGILTAAGDDHYFITRWTSYLPTHYAIELVGPYLGRLGVRLGLAAAMLLALWTLRPRWTTAQRLTIGTVAITMPIFMRAFMTDYVETTITSVGFLLVALALARRRSFVWGLLLGSLTAVMFVANPVGAVTAGPPMVLAVATGFDRSRPTFLGRVPVALVAGMGAGAVAVVTFGLVWFRARFGVPNVYTPTLDWIRANSDHVDSLKADTGGWWWYYTWIYAPPLLLATAAALQVTRRVRFDRTELSAFGLLAVQYALHWFDHLISHGNSIEVPYYWSLIFPSFGVAVALFLGRMTMSAGARVTVLGGLTWVAMLLFLPADLRLPVGPGILLTFALAVILVVVVGGRWLAAAGILTLLMILMTQIAAPAFAGDRFGFNMNPMYDQIYRAGDGASISEDLYREMVWFEDELDPVPRNGEALFVALGPWGGLLAAVYGAHVGGQLLNFENNVLTETELVAATRGGAFPVVVVVGPPDEVDRAVSYLDRPGTRAELALLEDSPEPLGYRLAVFDVAGAEWLPHTWPGAELPTITGTPGTTGMRAGPDAPAGFVTYGPYVSLPAAEYVVRLTYRSSTGQDVVVGGFDAVPQGGTPVTTAPLSGTGGETRTVDLRFTVEDPLLVWEFRVLRERGDLEVQELELRTG
jgi:hypothetical protein